MKRFCKKILQTVTSIKKKIPNNFLQNVIKQSLIIILSIDTTVWSIFLLANVNVLGSTELSFDFLIG